MIGESYDETNFPHNLLLTGKITYYNSVNVKLFDSQLDKLKSQRKIKLR